MPPTPETINRSEPGGDAHDPQLAALMRLGSEPWGWRNDKRDVVHVPLSDWPNWRRVRYWGISTFTGFRYGDKHRAAMAMWIRKLKADAPDDPQACLDEIQDWAEPMLDSYSVSVTEVGSSRTSWKAPHDVAVRKVNAKVSTLFSSRRYAAVLGATLGWPRTCVIYGYAFRSDDGAKNEAERVRDRFAEEAFQHLTLLHEQPPEGID